jgi:hypothetical protein
VLLKALRALCVVFVDERKTGGNKVGKMEYMFPFYSAFVRGMLSTKVKPRVVQETCRFQKIREICKERGKLVNFALLKN